MVSVIPTDRRAMTASDPLLPPDDADIERRFRDAGVVVPADRAAGTYAAARRLLATVHWLRKPRTAAVEPSHIFLPGTTPA